MKDEIKEKMTIGKAKKILRGFLAKDCYYDTPLYYAIPYLLDYITNLQEENEILKEKVDQYENPDDLTLFYMWLDTLSKDKMKQMEHEIISLKQNNAMITKLGEDYKTRNEKAIEYMNNYNELVVPDANIKSLILKEEYKKIIELLQGKSDE